MDKFPNVRIHFFMSLAFGHDLRGWRAFNDITQEQLGDMLNVNASTISLWERGKRTIPISKFLVLCGLMGINPMEYISYRKELNEATSEIIDIAQARAMMGVAHHDS